MGNEETIRIYLRLRPPVSVGQSKALSASSSAHAVCSYDTEHTFTSSRIAFHRDRRLETDVVNNANEDYAFKFQRVFEPSATQEEVFNTVARDCVLSVLDGYNSTIFAYGQTGSGKTYSITGGTDSYEERGIIPRVIALIYDEIAKRKEGCTWTVSISYLQIYNDKGQDLLNHGKDARTIEELPSVTVQDGEDEVILRGLELHHSAKLSDALNLLFLGDTNRLYCETPMNKTSSRSHCVFSVVLEAHQIGQATVRRSKLHLVDLAGSERVSKTGVGGTILTEAKYINLSLHYLEQVIIALSEQAKGRRDHIPFRNSFLTMVLRDSLGGNCRTSMLATAYLARSQLPETIGTCRFAQRVALISQDAQVNEMVDPHLLIRKLKTEVVQLKDRLAFHESGSKEGDRQLSLDEKSLCNAMVERFLQQTEADARIEGFEGDLARIFYCFSVLKSMVQGAGSGAHRPSGQHKGADDGASSASHQRLETLQLALQQKENEVSMLFEVINNTQRVRYNAGTQTAGGAERGSAVVRASLMPDARPMERGDSLASPTYPSTGGPQSLGSTTLFLSAPVVSPEVALAHAAGMTEAGQLNKVEAAAVTEFFTKKQTHLAGSSPATALSNEDLLKDRAGAFEVFKQSYSQYIKIEASKENLKEKYRSCKETASSLNMCVDRIKQIKGRVQQLRAERAVEGVEGADAEEKAQLQSLTAEKETYNALVNSLRQQKEDIEGMHAFMKHSQEQLTKDFDDWLAARQKQLSLATGVPEGGPDTCFAPPPPLPPAAPQTDASFIDSVREVKTLGEDPHHTLTPLQSMSPLLNHPLRVTAGTHMVPNPGPTTSLTSLSAREPPTTKLPLRSSISADGAAHSSGAALNPRLNPWVQVATPLAENHEPRPPSSCRSNGGTDAKLSPNSNPFHLQPINAEMRSSFHRQQVGSLLTSPHTPETPSSAENRNPYAPEHPSTGNAAADEQLAALYKAREAMRQKFVSQ